MATPVTAEVVGLQDLASALSLLWLLGTVLPTTCMIPPYRYIWLRKFMLTNSCGSHCPQIERKCTFRRKVRSRYIPTHNRFCRSDDFCWRNDINCNHGS